MKNELTPSDSLHLLHDVEELVSRFVEVNALAFAAKEGRRGAEVAAQRTSDRRNDGGCRVALTVRHPHSQDAEAEAGNDLGMLDWRCGIFAEITTHPRNALATNDVIRIN